MSSEALVPVVEVAPRVELGVIRADGPKELVKVATEAADALASVIAAKKLFSTINGRQYVRVEGWTTLATMMGCLPREVAVERDEKGTYTATVELVRMGDQAVLTRASAECGMDEPTWAKRADYARRSMAVTRATSKACRIAFSWVMVLAGYEVTPAEEIPEPTVHVPYTERGGTSTAPAKGEAAPVGSVPTTPTSPQRITEDDVFPTRDTPWPGEGKLKGKTVREWALNQLRAAESGEVKIPDEWLAIVKLELKARAAKAAV
jgi:hypothetical protein